MSRLVTVVVRPGHVVYADDPHFPGERRGYVAGQVLEVTTDEAKALEEQGVAERP